MRLKTLTLIVLSFLMLAHPVFAAKVTNIDTGESFECDGNSDQVEINSMVYAAGAGDTLLLSDGTFNIDKTINLKSGVTLKGSGNTVIKADPSAFFYEAAALIMLSDATSVRISDLTINGGEPDTSTQYSHSGHSYGNAIVLRGSTKNCTFENIYFTRLDGDAFRATGNSKHITVRDCTMKTTGHDGAQVWGGEYWLIEGCTMNLFINSGVRYANTANSIVQNCEFYCDTHSGFAGIELEDEVTNIEIRNNNFHDINNGQGMGIVTVHAHGNVNVYNNTFRNLPGGAMRVSGITVTENENTYEFVDTNTSEVDYDSSCDNGSCENCEYCDYVDDGHDSNDDDEYECGDDDDDNESGDTDNGDSTHVNPAASLDLITALTESSVTNAKLASEMVNASSTDILTAYQYQNVTGAEDIVAHLIESSEKKQEYAKELFEMSLEELDMSREFVNASIQD